MINKRSPEKIHRTPRSARTRGRSCLPAARWRPVTGLMASTTGRRSSATSSPACASPRRRSSARPPRLIPVDSFDEAIQAWPTAPAHGLSSSIFTRDVNKAFRAMRDLDTGITHINGRTIGAEVHLPFGGTKDTGNGHREAGQAALDVFTEWKSIYVDYSPPAEGPDRRGRESAGRACRSRAEALVSRRALPAAHRRLLQREQDSGREDQGRVRLALAPRHGRLFLVLKGRLTIKLRDGDADRRRRALRRPSRRGALSCRG